MFFLIFLGIALFGIGWLLYLTWSRDSFFYSAIGKFFSSLGVLIFGGLVGFFLSTMVAFGLAFMFTPNFEARDTDSTGLRATTAKDVTEGQFYGGIFASYGYIDGKRVISYVTESDEGAIRLGYVNASDAVLFEDSTTEPRLETHHWVKENWVFFPGPFETAETYSLYVPEGTVVDGFEIKP